jgi:hypothetical protein
VFEFEFKCPDIIIFVAVAGGMSVAEILIMIMIPVEKLVGG